MTVPILRNSVLTRSPTPANLPRRRARSSKEAGKRVALPSSSDAVARGKAPGLGCHSGHAQGGALLIPTPQASARDAVLIVDQSDESREVLRTVLERRGVDILETDDTGQGLELARRHQPRVIVFDLDVDNAPPQEVRKQYQDPSGVADSSIVFLGSVRCPTSDNPQNRYVSKPYHYAPLIRTIEQLLARE